MIPNINSFYFAETSSRGLLDILNYQTTASSVKLGFFEGLIILFLSTLIGIYIKYLFSRFSITYSSRISFGNTLLVLMISVSSLIAVVKTSLALSLGLVGALSVIRFRTAIKEPFNLSIMLFTICTAIAIGASQFIFAFQILIFGTIAIILSNKAYRLRNKNTLSLDVDEIDTITLSLPFNAETNDIYKILKDNTSYYSIISLDQENKEELNIVLKVKVNNPEQLSKIKTEIFDLYPKSGFSFYNTPSV